jgi:hypothetical protein
MQQCLKNNIADALPFPALGRIKHNPLGDWLRLCKVKKTTVVNIDIYRSSIDRMLPTIRRQQF